MRGLNSKAVCQFTLAHAALLPTVGDSGNDGGFGGHAENVGGGADLVGFLQIRKMVDRQLLRRSSPLCQTEDLVIFSGISHFASSDIFLFGQRKIRVILL